MRNASLLIVLVIAAMLAPGCAHHSSFAPCRTYLALPAVADMEGVVRWLELQRDVAVKVDGIDPASEEIRVLDARILAATEAWVREESAKLSATLETLVEEQGLGQHHVRVLELKRELAALDCRLIEARSRSTASQ